MSDFKTPMRELHKAHRDFKSEWQRWRNGELTRKEKKESNAYEPASVSAARKSMLTALDRLFVSQIYPLETELRSNPSSAADKIIEFLRVDIPAFRCGYAKEFLLSKLKTVELTEEQKQSLREIALEVCEANHFRREFRRWCRLMIVLADKALTEKLIKLAESPNRYAERKASWMLETIFRHRPDLSGKK
jgi:hypothetical protein